MFYFGKIFYFYVFLYNLFEIKNNFIVLYFIDLVDVVKRELKVNLEMFIKVYKCKWEFVIMGCFDILVRGWKLVRWVW